MQTVNLTSIGKLSAELQAPVATLQKIAAQLGIKPHTVINGVRHYDDDAAEKISIELASIREGASK